MQTPATLAGRSFVEYTAEPLAHGRAIMRCEVVIDGEVVQSYLTGSPAPAAVVREHERRYFLDLDDRDLYR